MILEKWLPELRRHKALTMVSSILLTGIAIALRQYVPLETPFLTMYPAALVSALVGGPWAGAVSLAITVIFAPYYIYPEDEWRMEYWGAISLIVFTLVCGIVIYIVDQLELARRRVQDDRDRMATQAETLRLAIRAADGGSWEWKSPNSFVWDQSFYQLLGLDPAKHQPSLDLYLSFVHPDDRNKLQAGQCAIPDGKSPEWRGASLYPP